LFKERISSARRDRPELARLLDRLRRNDVVVVTRLDRLARSTGNMLGIAEAIRAKEAGLLSLAELRADTTSPVRRQML
jgi:DNA invertase Pin-like site-specific DNA recombinase